IHFVTSERIIIRQASTGGRVTRCPVIAQKKDQRVIQEVIRLKGLQHLSDAVVQRNRHRRVNLPGAIGNISNSLEIAVRRNIIRCMDSVICQVKKERLRRVAIDKIDSFPSERISQIFRFYNRRLISVKLRMVVMRARVQKTVELIETPLRWIMVKLGPQMPFA